MQAKEHGKRYIMLLEDDEDLAEGIELSLRSDDVELVSCRSIAQAEEQMKKRTFDLLILDINLPDGSGLAFCRSVRASSRVPIAMLTVKDMEMDIVRGLECGADDYITKPFGMMEFVARVKAVLRRCARQSEERELHCKGLRVNVSRHEVSYQGEMKELTRKEFELLEYLLENKGLVMSRNQILCHVWGYDFDGETRTVDVHVRTLRQKLGEAGNLIETVRGVGYRIGDHL